MSFISTLLNDIQQHQPYDGKDLVQTSVDELGLGSIYAKSNNGSIIEFFSYYDLNYKTDHPIYTNGWCQKIINVRFHILARRDKAIFKQWDDFQLFDTEVFHRYIQYMINNGFKLYNKPAQPGMPYVHGVDAELDKLFA